MPLAKGTRLGPYEIVEPIGAGGMGSVYRALDTRLDRAVALKVLSDRIAKDDDFRRRFEREARTISKLAHPNICTLFDVGEHDGSPFIVMECLEGETLAARLEHASASGTPAGLPIDEALKIAREVSSALDEAHRAGVVHRDLKPGNIMLTRSGAKLLDFGLAKPIASAIVTTSGTIVPVAASGALTSTGTIVGTFQYMAPEQLEGNEADTRADIFSFGAILFEMITGRKAFEGRNQVSLIGAILKDQPPPITTVVPVAPKALDRIIQACLAKDPDARLRSAHDLVVQLQMVAEGRGERDVPPAEAAPTPAAARAPRSGSWAAMFAAAFAGAFAAAFGMAAFRGAPAGPAPRDPLQFTIPPPENGLFGAGQAPAFAVSPDGRHIVFVATVTPGGSMLFVRSMATLGARQLPGTEQADYPFWSPDSRSVGFFAGGKLKTIQISSGSPIVACETTAGRGGTWNTENTILFASAANSPIMRVSGQGGASTPVTRLDDARGETAHRWPAFLPDGRHFLYVAVTSGKQPTQLKVASIDGGEPKPLMTGDSATTYHGGGLYFWRDGGIVAQPFDATTLQLSGAPVRVVEPVTQQRGYASFSLSSSGVMAYIGGSVRPISQLTWVDRSGKPTGTLGDPGDYWNIALAPDEKRVAVSQVTGSPENRDIWVIDVQRGVRSRLTSDPAVDVLPSWSPDGSRLLFTSPRTGVSRFLLKNADGTGSDEELMTFGLETANAMDWSPDGRYVLYYSQSPATDLDLWVIPMIGDHKPVPFLQTKFREDHGTFARDSRSIAYSSDESGRTEVYVQSFPAAGARIQVSRGGGTEPRWRGDGREIFFLAPDGMMMAAAIDAAHGTADAPKPLFPSGVAFSGNRRQYAVTKDGQGFIIGLPQQRSSPTPLTVVINPPSAAHDAQ